MDAARFNVFWFLSIFIPAVIMLAASLGRRWWLSGIAALASVATTYWLCLLAVSRKWSLRLELAATEAQRQWVYDSDGGDQAFTAVVTGPLEAILYTMLWAFLGWKLVSMYQSRSSNKSMEPARER
jgi:hypothetical protein